MVNLTHEELKNAKLIVDIGLKKASESMSFFMKEKMILNNTDFKISKPQKDSLLKPDDREKTVYLLTTEIIGELTGACYLVFTEEEVEKLIAIALPANVLNDPIKKEGMKEAILLELDNIISASVVTQFSNILKIKMYGGVPKLERVRNADFSTCFQSNISDNQLLIGFKTQFKSKDGNFSPEFLWMLNDKFLTSVQKLSEDNESISKLEQIAIQ